MKDNQYTQKSITAINAAQALASEYGNQELSQAHLLAALTDSADNLVYQLLGKMQLDAAAVHSAAVAAVEKLPRVSGSAREQGKVYVTAEMDKALREAAAQAERMHDEYISVEHLMMGLLSAPDRTMKEIMQRFNLTQDGFLKALSAVRGAQITDHRYLTGQVTCTAYDNGVSVYVNYGETAYTADGLTVPAGDYAVKGGAS